MSEWYLREDLVGGKWLSWSEGCRDPAAGRPYSLSFLCLQLIWQASRLSDRGPTVPEMIYGSLLYKPFHIPPHPLFANSSWYVNETLDSELWLTVLKTIVQDTWTTIELVFRSIKGPLLHWDYFRLPCFPQGPGERNALKKYLKESQVVSLKSKKKGGDMQPTG